MTETTEMVKDLAMETVDNAIESGEIIESARKIGFKDVGLLGLAAVGAGTVLYKGYKIVKALPGKVKTMMDNRKNSDFDVVDDEPVDEVEN